MAGYASPMLTLHENDTMCTASILTTTRIDPSALPVCLFEFFPCYFDHAALEDYVIYIVSGLMC